ncbi:MAG: hypothetical protein ACRC77_11495 [Bacteroidales bacterium]
MIFNLILQLLMILGLLNLCDKETESEETPYILLEASLERGNIEHLKWVELDYFECSHRKYVVTKCYLNSVNQVYE